MATKDEDIQWCMPNEGVQLSATTPSSHANSPILRNKYFWTLKVEVVSLNNLLNSIAPPFFLIRFRDTHNWSIAQAAKIAKPWPLLPSNRAKLPSPMASRINSLILDSPNPQVLSPYSDINYTILAYSHSKKI